MSSIRLEIAVINNIWRRNDEGIWLCFIPGLFQIWEINDSRLESVVK